jgi:hypothetical protein
VSTLLGKRPVLPFNCPNTLDKAGDDMEKYTTTAASDLEVNLIIEEQF